MTDPNDQRAIDTLRRDVATYRALALAALDSLRDAYTREQTLKQQIAEMRQERARFARSVFAADGVYPS